MASATNDVLDKAWRSTCRVLFGQEVGPLSDFEEWLSEYDEEIRHELSSLSGKALSFSQNDYAASARFIAFDEVDLGKKFLPLSINDVKDIDTIMEAVQERFCYTGNVILGHSSNVKDSSNVTDSHYVLNSTVVNDSKYVACSRYVGYGEYCFGLLGAEYDMHSIKCMGSELKRCFECHMVEVLSDCYYCAKTQNCHDCFFCFGMENGAYAIGNTQIGREKYLSIKSKLLSEIAEKLKKDKEVLSLLKLVEACSDSKPDTRLKLDKENEPQFDMAPIEKAFSRTTSLLLGKEMRDILSFGKFLKKHVPQNAVVASPLSGHKTVVCGYRVHILERYKLGKRLVTEEEMRSIGRNSGLASLENLTLDVADLRKKMHPVAYTNMDKVAGNCRNYSNCPVIIDSQDCYDGSAFINSKKCAHCFWPSKEEAVFGSCAEFNSSFCMKCYYSKNMARSFECDGCESCSDLYYSHNCENVKESMFCFNAKNLSYAIGNAALAPDNYRKIKSSIVAQLAGELEKKKDLKWDIFNIGAKRN